MPLLAVFFVLGDLVFHRLSELPTFLAWCALVVLLVVSVTMIGLLRRRLSRSLHLAMLAGIGACGGFVWASAYAAWHVPPHLPSDTPRHDLVVEGWVQGLPQVRGSLTRIIFAASTIDFAGQRLNADWRFRVSWHDAPELRPGERWVLPLRLKTASGYATPGAWDYEGWLYHQGIRYTGYVRDGLGVRRVGRGRTPSVDAVRAQISRLLAAATESDFANGVLRALVVADRSGLDDGARQIFRDTGTSHLMAVSGLHIGLVSGAVMMLSGALWRLIPAACGRVPTRIAAAAVGLVAAFVYSALAGFGLPTQRALIMLGVFVAALIGRREPSAIHGVSVAVLLVLAWHPPSVLDAGFWLSFGAVVAIFAALRWTRYQALWVRAVAVQAVITLGLTPILAVYGLPVSALSPLVNLVLVPAFGILIVPASLIGGLLVLVSEQWASLLLMPLAGLLDGIEVLLRLVAELSWFLPPVAGVVPAMLSAAILWMIAPPGIPMRWVGAPLCLLPWLPRPDIVEHGAFHFHLLDVGQGLSAVVETRHHVLVFDTGPEFSSGFSTAEAVVLPFLRRRGYDKLDRLIVSHADNDHAGGTHILLDALTVAETWSGEPADLGPMVRRCQAGDAWRWDGVQFQILHPATGSVSSGNNASCVLRVDNAAGSLLLTGDIEAAVEQRLVTSAGESLSASVVVAPHHGSASSSTQRFVEAVDAEQVLFAAGWANRYGFPDPDVVERWALQGATPFDTAMTGTLSFDFSADGTRSGPVSHRQVARRFWNRGNSSAGLSLAVSSAVENMSGASARE